MTGAAAARHAEVQGMECSGLHHWAWGYCCLASLVLAPCVAALFAAAPSVPAPGDAPDAVSLATAPMLVVVEGLTVAQPAAPIAVTGPRGLLERQVVAVFVGRTPWTSRWWTAGAFFATIPAGRSRHRRDQTPATV